MSKVYIKYINGIFWHLHNYETAGSARRLCFGLVRITRAAERVYTTNIAIGGAGPKPQASIHFIQYLKCSCLLYNADQPTTNTGAPIHRQQAVQAQEPGNRDQRAGTYLRENTFLQIQEIKPHPKLFIASVKQQYTRIFKSYLLFIIQDQNSSYHNSKQICAISCLDIFELLIVSLMLKYALPL